MMVVMSSARDEHDTVPPPAGEEDAYSAATKVGAMPAELMARLRAEGLLPEDEGGGVRRSPPPLSGADSTSRLPALTSSASQPAGRDELPELTLDPSLARPPSIPGAARLPSRAEAIATPKMPLVAGVTPTPPVSVETPTAFSPPSAAPLAPPEPPMTVAADAGAFRQRSVMQTIAAVVAVVVALVAFAFVMALLSRQ